VDELPDEREDDVTRTDVPVSRPEPTGPVSGQVRIVGAEPAGESTAELPVVSRHDDIPEDADDASGADVPEADGPALEPLPLVDGGFDQPSVRLTDQPGTPEGAADAVNPVSPGETAVPSGTPTELPHWTEPPTGQVPAVLARDAGDEGPGSGIAGPSWREEDSDWVDHDELFEPGVLGDDDVALGSLDETNRTDIERRPWEFDLDPSESGQSHLRGQRNDGGDTAAAGIPVDGATSSPAAPDRDDSEENQPASGRPSAGRAPGLPERSTPVAAESAAASAAPSAAAAAAEAGSAAGHRRDPDLETSPDPMRSLFPSEDGSVDEELLAADKPLPTGSARMGRARRSGLLPSRLRAKRPGDIDDVTDAPRAAEPPGASVTDVPGAGKRLGLAGLAAADRTAEREVEGQADELAPAAGPAVQVTDAATVAVADVVTRKPVRRLLRRTPDARATPPVAGKEGRGPTGGAPPRPNGRRPAAGAGVGGQGGGARTSSVGLRVGTGLAVAVVALLAFKFGTVPSLVLVVVVITFAAGECFSVLRRAGYHPATLLGLVGTISLTVGAYTKGVDALPLVLVLITAFTLLWYLLGIERGSPVAGTAATLLTVGWVSLMGSYAGLLLSPSAFPDRHGIAFLLGAIIATVANDVGALVIGGWLGRRPLAPTISPNKTWEGLFGGAVFSIVVSTVVVGAIHPWSPAHAALLGVVVAVVAPVGDLCESLLKRDLRLKDMGTLLPGHGGVLDRVDALLFVLPATYYLVRALNIA
jgi:phosphatidate cytidylyltransferase